MRRWLLFLWTNELNQAGPGSGDPVIILFGYSSAPLDSSGLCQIDFLKKIIRTRIWELARARKTFQTGVFSTVLPFE